MANQFSRKERINTEGRKKFFEPLPKKSKKEEPVYSEIYDKPKVQSNQEWGNQHYDTPTNNQLSNLKSIYDVPPKKQVINQDGQEEQYYKEPIKHYPNSELEYDTPTPRTKYNSSSANNLNSQNENLYAEVGKTKKSQNAAKAESEENAIEEQQNQDIEINPIYESMDDVNKNSSHVKDKATQPQENFYEQPIDSLGRNQKRADQVINEPDEVKVNEEGIYTEMRGENIYEEISDYQKTKIESKTGNEIQRRPLPEKPTDRIQEHEEENFYASIDDLISKKTEKNLTRKKIMNKKHKKAF